MRIDIEVEKDRLTKDLWRFVVIADIYKSDIKVDLDEYCRFTRPSTRHRNWHMQESYLRGGDRRLRMHLMEHPPRVPEHVFRQVRDRLQASTRYNFTHEYGS